MCYTSQLSMYSGGLLALRVVDLQPYSDFSTVQCGFIKPYHYQQCTERSVCSTSLSVLGIFILAILAMSVGIIMQFYFSSS